MTIELDYFRFFQLSLEVFFNGEMEDHESFEDFTSFILTLFEMDLNDERIYDIPEEDSEKPIKEAKFKSLQEMQPVYDAWLGEITLREDLHKVVL